MMFGARKGLTYNVWLTPAEIETLDGRTVGLLETEEHERLKLQLSLLPEGTDGPNGEALVSEEGVHIRVLPLYLDELVDSGRVSVVTDNMELIIFHDVSRSGPSDPSSSILHSGDG